MKIRSLFNLLLFIIGISSISCSNKKKSNKKNKEEEEKLKSGLGSAGSSVGSSPTKKNQNQSSLGLCVPSIEIKDLMALTDKLQEVSTSPIKSLDKDTKRFSLDFDCMDKCTYHCDLFGYEERPCPVANKECWKYPLQEPGDNLCVLQLHDYIVKTIISLKEVFVLKYSEWGSDVKKVSSYVMVIVASLVQLDFLATRLNISPDFPKKSVIYNDISIYLKTLTDCFNLFQFESGKSFVAIYLSESSLHDPTIYFNSLVSLFRNKHVKMIDEVFQYFVDFFFNAFARSYRDKLLASLVENCDFDHWIPLPIYYFSNRLVHEKPEIIPIFIKSWMRKVWDVLSIKKTFDSRHLVELGHLMNQSLMTPQTLQLVLQMVLCLEISSVLEYDSNLILTLSLISLSPGLQPLDAGNEIHPVFVDLSSPLLPESFHKFDLITTAERFQFIVETWKVLLVEADFSKISTVDYETFCKLIYILDQIYPGISANLWSIVKFKGEMCRQTGLDIESILKERMSRFFQVKAGLDDKDKIDFLTKNFSKDETIETYLVNSDLYLDIVKFMSSIIIETISTIPGSENADQIIDFCVNYLNSIFELHKRTRVFDCWINTLQYDPVKLFETLNDLWMNEKLGKSLRDSNLVKNLVHVVDYSKDIARSLMMILITKTIEYDRPAIDFQFRVPACLTKKERSEYLVELFNSAAAVASTVLPECFFASLGRMYQHFEISHEDVSSIVFNLTTKSNLVVNSNGDLFGSFLDYFVIPKTDKFYDSYKNVYGDKLPSEEEFNTFNRDLFVNYIKLLQSNFQYEQFNSKLLQTISGFLHQTKLSVIRIDNEAPLISEEALNILDLSAIPEGMLEILGRTLFKLSIECISKGIRKNQARDLLLKLAFIASIATKMPKSETETFNIFLLSFDILLSSLLSANVLDAKRETDTIKIMFVFYSMHYNVISLILPTLFQAAKCKESLMFLYTTVIEIHAILHRDCFSVKTDLDKDSITSVQIKYFKMIAALDERKTNEHLFNISNWIQIGKMDESATKYLCENVIRNSEIMSNSIRPLAILSNILSSNHYSSAFKITAIDLIFSKNLPIVLSYIFDRRTQYHYIFFEMVTSEFGLELERYLSVYSKENWYPSFSAELVRYKNHNRTKSSLDVSSFDSLNLGKLKLSFENIQKLWAFDQAPISQRHMLISSIKYMIYPINYSMNNIFSRSGMVYSSTYDLIGLILSIIWKGTKDHGDGIYVKGDLQLYSELIKLILNHTQLHVARAEYIDSILDTITTENDRKYILSLIISMVSFDCIPFDKDSLLKIHSWFRSFKENDCTSGPLASYESFFNQIVDNSFKNINQTVEVRLLRRRELSSNPFIFVEYLFTFLNSLFELDENDSLFSVSIHMNVLEKVLEHGSPLDRSDAILLYLQNVVENYTNAALLSKIVSILETFPMILISSASLMTKNVAFWGKLRKFAFRKFDEFDESNNYQRLNFLSTVGVDNSSSWERFFHKMADVDLPNKFLIKVFAKLASIKKITIEIVGLLPDELNIDDFEVGADLRTVLSFIPKIIDAYTAESAIITFTSDIIKVLFMLIDFSCKTNCAKAWSWTDVIGLFIGVDSDLIATFSDHLTKHYPNLLFESTSDSAEVLSFIYEINSLSLKMREDSDSFKYISEIIEKAEEVYGIHSCTKSITLQDDSMEALKQYTDLVKQIEAESVNNNMSDLSLVNSNGLLDSISNICSTVSNVRADGISQESLKYAFILLKSVYSSDVDSFDGHLLNEFCDKIVAFIAVHCEFNSISIARTISELEIEAFIKFVGEYMSTDSFEEFKKVLDLLYKFANDLVSECIFDNISEADFRVDLCLFPNDIIKTFPKIIKSGFDHVETKEWPQFYLDGINAGFGDDISAEHYDNFYTLLLLNESEMETDDFVKIWSTFSVEFFHKNSEDSDHVPIIKLVQKIITCDRFESLETSIEDVFKHFITEELMELLILKSSESETVNESESILTFMKLISTIKTKYNQEIKEWFKTIQGSAKKTLLDELEKKDKQLKIAAIHTKIAKDFVKRLQEIQFEVPNDLKVFLNSLASLNLESVRTAEMNEFQIKFAVKLVKIKFDESWREEMVRAVNLLLTCPSHTFTTSTIETKTDLLFQLGRLVFSDKIFSQFITLYPTDLMKILDNFKDLITFDNFTAIYEQSQNYLSSSTAATATSIKISDLVEVLNLVAVQSNLKQTLDFVKKVKTSLDLEVKLNLLMTCKQAESHNPVSDLFQYIKSFQSNKVMVAFVLQNSSLMSSFVVSSNAADVKNRRDIISFLRHNLTRKEYLHLVKHNLNEISSIGQTILGLIFKPSSTTSGFTLNTCEIETLYSILDNYVSDVNSSDVYGNGRNRKARALVIGFRFFAELDKIKPDLAQEHKILPSLVENLAKVIENSSGVVYTPESVYDIVRLSRRVVDKRKDRVEIIKKILFSKKDNLKISHFRAALDALIEPSAPFDRKLHFDQQLHADLLRQVEDKDKNIDITLLIYYYDYLNERSSK